jgi:uncharacterized protein
MIKRYAVAGFVILVTVVSIVAFVWARYPWVFLSSYTISIATGPFGGDWHKVLEAFNAETAQERLRIRLDLKESADIKESAETLQQGKVDLATVRSDHPAAASGGTLVILRRIPLVIMVPANSRTKSMNDLLGKKIAVLEDTDVGDPLLATVMGLYGLKSSNIIKTTVSEIGETLRDKRAAAVFAIGAAGPGAVTDAVQEIVKVTKKPPKFLNLEEAKAIAVRNPVYEEVEIPQGAFVVAPAIPSEKLTTVAVTVRLVARRTMANYVAGEVTRLLLAARAKLATTIPDADAIEAPDTDKNGVIPLHPGASAYLTGVQESLFEQTMNQLFNLSIIGGIFGSFVIGLRGLWRRHQSEEAKDKLARLPALMREVRSAPFDRLDVIEEELDNLAEWLLERFVSERVAPDRISGIATIISEIRRSIERKRTRVLRS